MAELVSGSLDDADLPALYRAADRASLHGQRRQMRGVAVSLGLTLVAAVFGAFSLRFGGRPIDWSATAAAAAFIAAILVSAYLIQAEPASAWFDGRAAAESTKTLAWQYAVGGKRFRADGSNADEEMLTELGQVSSQLGDLPILPSAADQEITPRMRELREAPIEARVQAYTRGRIEQQIHWYTQMAQWNAKRASLWRLVTVALQGAGATGAILKASGVVKVDVLGIAAAAAAAAAAWLETKDHATLARAYTMTVHDLHLVRERLTILPSPLDEQSWAEFVNDAEQAISREHTLWLARRGLLRK
jgi:hypothetical protein